VEAAALAGDERRREAGTYDIDEILEYQTSYREVLPVVKAAVAVGDLDILAPMLSQFLMLYRYENRLNDSDFRRLALAYGRAVIRTNEKLLRRYEGDDVPTPTLAARQQHMLSEVVRDYIDKYPSVKHEAMFKKVCGVLPMLLEVVGDKAIHTLRQTDINRFFEVVNQLPPRWKDIARQRSLGVLEVARLRLGEMAPATFEGTYKAVVTPFLKTAITNWQDRGFPATLTTEMLRYTGNREEGEAHQRAFHDAELVRLYEGRELEEFSTSKNEQHKFWLPHLGLFTGARVNELCQLNPKVDILKDESSGVWYLNITEQSEADENITKTVKTNASRRRVPIHSQLIEMGFLRYVDGLKRAGKTLLFDGFKPGKKRAATEAEKWFRQFLKDIGLRDETPGARLVGMHAYRSTFLNRALNLGVVNAEAITGHAQNMTNLVKSQDSLIGGETSAVVKRYQGELDISVKSAIIERIHYSGLKFFTPGGF
jgi:integrase